MSDSRLGRAILLVALLGCLAPESVPAAITNLEGTLHGVYEWRCHEQFNVVGPWLDARRLLPTVSYYSATANWELEEAGLAVVLPGPGWYWSDYPCSAGEVN